MIILGTNSIKGGYDVANSLRFNSASDDNLSITPSSASNRKTFTISAWVKRANLGTTQTIIDARIDSNDNCSIFFNDDDNIFIKFKVSPTSQNTSLTTNRKFRDVSAWLNIVLAVDMTQGTDTNRVKFYVNGVQETSFSSATYLAQNTDTTYNNTNEHQLGSRVADTSQDLDGYMAEVCLIDGQQLAPTSFGEFDEDSPTVWKPKNFKSDVTFGTNGFYLEFKQSGTSANSSGIGADTSGNDHHFTVNNLTAVDQSIDTCTNNFCTINVLDNESGNITISEGNLKFKVTGNADETNRGTFGFTKGKWYFESKYIDDTDDGQYVLIGVASASDTDIATPRSHMEMAGYYSIQLTSTSPGVRPFDNGSAGSGLGNSAVDDIHMYAIDMDNNKFYAGRNGTWYASGDPAGNSNPLITMDDGYTTLMPSICTKQDGIAGLNFGSPFYAISSGNADANGYGNFEYSVPSGYYSLCTKNLAEFG